MWPSNSNKNVDLTNGLSEGTAGIMKGRWVWLKVCDDTFIHLTEN